MRNSFRVAAVVFALFPAAALSQNFDTGMQAYNSGDFTTALKVWQPLAEQGDIDAQYNLGWMYARGEAVPKDTATALSWFLKSAKQGDAKSQYVIGLFWAKGLGVTKDATQAASWFRLAAEQGFAKAQYDLGTMYASGNGVARDDAEAQRWYRKAAAQGYPKQEGLPQNPRPAPELITGEVTAGSEKCASQLHAVIEINQGYVDVDILSGHHAFQTGNVVFGRFDKLGKTDVYDEAGSMIGAVVNMSIFSSEEQANQRCLPSAGNSPKPGNVTQSNSGNDCALAKSEAAELRRKIELYESMKSGIRSPVVRDGMEKKYAIIRQRVAILENCR